MFTFDRIAIQHTVLAMAGALVFATTFVGAAVWPGHEAQYAGPVLAASAQAADRAEA